jgi:hypothetical protein
VLQKQTEIMKETSAVPRSVWLSIALWGIFFGTTVLLQFLAGSYHSEFSGYPDESAHYVTSLMFRDFIAGLDYSEPVKFATDYYAHYPKVAIGHWPPFFYTVEGIWMLLFSTSRTSVMLGLAMFTTFLAWLTYTFIKRRFGWKAGALAGLLLICLPLVQRYSDEVMSETLLTIVSFAAALYFGRYIETQRWQDSALFGLFASLAILTKGSGWDLALIPPVALLLTRQFKLLARWTFWLPAVIVVVLCAPWQWMTMGLANQGWNGGDHPTLGYTTHALKGYAPVFVNLLGWGLTPLVLVGLAITIVVPYFKKNVEPAWAATFALIPAAWIFHSVVPVGVEDRKMIIAVPAMIALLFAGGFWVARRFQWNPAIVAAAAILIFALQQFSLVSEVHYGYIEAARYISGRKDLQNARILISSERDGEGMLTSELAMADPVRTGHKIFRGTKVLSKTDWDGNVFACLYQTPDALMQYLQQDQIGIVVSDTLPPFSPFQHQKVLLEAIRKYPDHLKLIASFRGEMTGSVNIYSVN